MREMASLYLDNYDASSEERFLADLREKDEVVLLYADGRLAGFTTLKIFERNWNHHPVLIVYSGDTIVSPEHWGQQNLAFAWLARVGQIKKAHSALPLYWFLLVKGHRTFKYLPVFLRSFFPHWELNRDDLKPLADELARERFGAAYNPATGVVEFQTSQGHLKEAIAYATPAEMSKPCTRFFFERNPGYLKGHELVCLCEFEAHNLRPLGARIFQRALDESACAPC